MKLAIIGNESQRGHIIIIETDKKELQKLYLPMGLLHIQ